MASLSDDRSYIYWTLAGCLGTLLVLGGANVVIDPYNFFRYVSREGFNASKPATGNRAGFSKAYMIHDIPAETVLLGASRLDVGLDPEYSAWQAADRPVFNFGVAGSSIYSRFRYLQHAIGVHSPRRVVFSIDFEAFLSKQAVQTARYPPEPNDSDERLSLTYEGQATPGRKVKRLRDALAATLSLAATVGSIKTLLSQDQNWLSRYGLSSGSARFGSEVFNKGNFSVFRDVLEAQAKVLPDHWLELDGGAMRALEDAVRFSLRRGIQMIVMLPPSHAFVSELWREAGLWKGFERWKYSVVEAVDGINREFPSAAPAVVWDFARYHEPAQEPVPVAGDTSRVMEWFWEPVHYRLAMGNLMLEEILGDAPARQGRRLEPKSVCRDIEDDRRNRERYVQGRPDQLQLFRSLNLAPKPSRTETAGGSPCDASPEPHG